MSIIDTLILNGVVYLLSGESETDLTADLKAALDQLVQKVAYIDEDGQDYYDDLHSALYPPANLSYISCVYTQSGYVSTNDSLDSLKSDLVVTAHMTDGTTSIVPSTDYILSGTLVAGTSTITVTYGGKTTTFTVTVTQGPLYPLENGTFTFTTYPHVVTVENGNRVTVVHANLSNDCHANISNVSNNTSVGNATANYLNDGQIYFTIPSGSTLSATAKVISVSGTFDPSRTKTNLKFYKEVDNAPVAVLSVMNDILMENIAVGDEYTNSVTVNEDTNISCLGLRLINHLNYQDSLGLEITATLDGVRII